MKMGYSAEFRSLLVTGGFVRKQQKTIRTISEPMSGPQRETSTSVSVQFAVQRRATVPNKLS